MKDLNRIFKEMLDHIDSHKEGYKDWGNEQIVDAWIKTKEHELKLLGICIVSHNVKKEEINCFSCENCDLYENQTSSERYFCRLTEDFIDDVNQYYCDDHKPT